jgi:antitoxin ParD1/3/4
MLSPEHILKLAKFCQKELLMSTMNISLPESLKVFVDEQVNQRGYGTSSEYLRELIRKDQDRQALRALLMDGLHSKSTQVADSRYFDGLREKVRNNQ